MRIFGLVPVRFKLALCFRTGAMLKPASSPKPRNSIPSAMHKVQIAPSAEGDLLDGYAFDELQDRGVGDYFLQSLASDIESLGLYAGIHPKSHLGLYRTASKPLQPMRCTVRTKWPGSAKRKFSRSRLVKQNAHALRPAWSLSTQPAPTRATPTKNHTKTPSAFHPFRCIQTKSAPARACPQISEVHYKRLIGRKPQLRKLPASLHRRPLNSAGAFNPAFLL